MEQINSLQYFIDIGNVVVFGTPVKFIEKYEGIDHYQKVIDDQTKLEKLLYKIISQENSNSQNFNLQKLVEQSGFDGQSFDFINQMLRIKYSQYKRQLIKKELFQGGKHLANFNWRIKNIMGCNEFTHKNRIILKLQLFISEGKNNDKLQTICLQLGILQARQFLLKLKQVAKEAKGTNY